MEEPVSPDASDVCVENEGGGRMVRIEKMIPDDLLASLRIYLKAAKVSHGGFCYQKAFGRIAVHDDLLMVMVHKRLLPVAEMMFWIPLRRSNCYTVIYGKKGVLPKHLDKLKCEFSLDVCINDTAPETLWKLYVEDAEYIKQVHWREGSPKPGQEITMAFFYFVDESFTGGLRDEPQLSACLPDLIYTSTL